MLKSISKILAAAAPMGDIGAIQKLGQEASRSGADAIALLGSLTPKNSEPRTYGEVLKALAEPGLPAFYIPGPEDVPISEFLREAANLEIVYPYLRGVHGVFAMAPRYIVVVGMGGEIKDEQQTTRDEVEALRYPGWEVEYRLKFINDLKDYEKVFLFTTPPQHKRLMPGGSSVLAEMVKTYNPALVLVAGQAQTHELLGKSLVVVLGSLAEGDFTLVNLRKKEVTPGNLNQAVKAA